MSLRFSLAWVLGKITRFILKISSQQGATALPGLVALKIDPDFIERQTRGLKNIVISGTNGKTTTARMLATILEKSNIPFIHNRQGSNLLRGIASSLVASSTQRLKICQVGLWETDEGIFPQVIKKIKPEVVLLLNLFRDQLDRYGEIDTIAKKWLQALKKLPKKTLIIINADDPFLAFIGQNIPQEKIYFGLKTSGKKEATTARDINFCPICSKRLSYQVFFMAHLGNFHCSKCLFKNPNLDFYCSEILNKNTKSNSFIIENSKKNYPINLNLPGIYNIYNSLAAFSVASIFKLSPKIIVNSLENFQPAFGRVETIEIQKRKVKIFLVKNPTGFNQILQVLKEKKACNLLIAINDLIADGQDVSWLWDVDFGLLKGRVEKFLISGLRAEDMALRLKYEGFRNIRIQKNLEKAIFSFTKFNRNLYILPTYTAMLEVRKILSQKGIVHPSWED